MENLIDLNWQEASVRGRSKREIYRLMTMKAKCYLPPEPQATSEFVHDVMTGKKKVWIPVAYHYQGAEAQRRYHDSRTADTWP